MRLSGQGGNKASVNHCIRDGDYADKYSGILRADRSVRAGENGICGRKQRRCGLLRAGWSGCGGDRPDGREADRSCDRRDRSSSDK